MSEYLFHLPRSSNRTLQVRIRQMLVDAILAGHIPENAPLPSSRRLAEQLSVARNTVVLAYQQLVDEGYLLARERSGYYVNGDILNRVKYEDELKRRPVSTALPDWSRRLNQTPSQQPNITKPHDWRNYRYPFIYGQLDPGLFPIADWRECSRESVNKATIHDWSVDRVDLDDPHLIEQIHTRLLPRRGVWADPEEILITVGAQHALYLLAQLLINERSRVGLENPGYPDARNIMINHRAGIVPLLVDDQGVVVNANINACDYVYVTPSHQAPTGVTLPMKRRHDLLEKARRHDVLIIEDDYESELNYVDEPSPALKSLDVDERVIYIGSLSKTLAPGLRVGFLVAPRPLIREARALRRLMVRHPPSNNQRTVAEFLRLGHHDSLVRRLRLVYRERWQAMLDALRTQLPECGVLPTYGGTSFWLRGPQDLDTANLAKRAAEQGLLIEPGDIYYLQDATHNCMRLGFSAIPTDAIAPGIGLLAKLIHQRSTTR